MPRTPARSRLALRSAVTATGGNHELRHQDRADLRRLVRDLPRRRGRPLHGARVQAAAPRGDRPGRQAGDRRLHEHHVHRLDDARRPRRRRQAPPHERRPALARLQRPQHHEDLRDHRARSRLRDLRDTRRGGLEARRRLPTQLVALRTFLAPAAAVLLIAVATAGCGAVGRVTTGDVSAGKTLFQAKCASCHTLADAKSQGTIGPNLDDAFASDKSQGFSQQTMADIVRGQIAYPEEPMPANLVEGENANSVARYIAQCAANANCGVTATAVAPSGGTTTSATPQGKPDGKQVYASAGCGGCHTMKAGGSTGNVGPNLDQLKPSKDAVAHQVTVGGGAMPAFKGQLSDAQIQAVAEYVASNAGK